MQRRTTIPTRRVRDDSWAAPAADDEVPAPVDTVTETRRQRRQHTRQLKRQCRRSLRQTRRERHRRFRSAMVTFGCLLIMAAFLTFVAIGPSSL